MNPFEILILSVFDWIMIILISLKLANIEKIKIAKAIFFILIGSIFIAINSFFGTNYVLNHIGSTVINFILLRLFIGRKRLKLSDYTIVFILTFGFLFIMQMGSVVFIKSAINSFEYNLMYGLLSQSLATIIAIAINRYVPIQTLYIFIEHKNIVFKTLIINLYIVYFFTTILWFIGIEQVLASTTSIIVIIMLSLLMNTIFLRTSLINQVSEEKLKVFETYLPIIDNVMEEFKCKQHDYHNHIQSLSIMKDNPILFDAQVYEDYVTQVITQEIWSYLIKLDNKILMAFFYSKYKDAKEKGVNTKFEIRNYFVNSSYTDYQLVEIYGILIDNAIEASIFTDSKNIKISLKLQDGKNFFRVENSSKIVTPVEVGKLFGRGYSTKSGSNRGFGLYKLKKIIEKEKGIIMAYYDTNEEKMVIELLHS